MSTRIAVVWAPRALDRMEEAARYIAQDRPGAALRWAEELFARVKLLAIAPRQGRVVPELEREDIREIFFEKYRVVYRVETQRILILTVRHVRRLFDPGEIEDAERHENRQGGA